jgi:hypothetical protein
MAKDVKPATLEDQLIEANKRLAEAVREHIKGRTEKPAKVRAARLALEEAEAEDAESCAQTTNKKTAAESEVARLQDLIRQRDEQKGAA